VMVGRYETPAHLYPASLVADDDGGDAGELVIPEDLTAHSDEELAALSEAAEAAFDGLTADEDIDAADLQAITALADSIEGIRAEIGNRETAAAERAEAVAAQRARVHGDPEASTDGDEAGDGEGS